jgi:hypothetical protein
VSSTFWLWSTTSTPLMKTKLPVVAFGGGSGIWVKA